VLGIDNEMLVQIERLYTGVWLKIGCRRRETLFTADRRWH
jgi:hypothetical protein